MGVRGKSLALVAVVAVAVIVGILALVQGGKEATTVGSEAVADAAQRTSRVDGMRYSMTGETDVPDVGKVPFTGTGVSEAKGDRGTAHIDMAEFAKHAGAGGPESDPDNWKMDMVMDGRLFYMKFPLLKSELGGKSWMRFDIVAVAKAAGIDPSLVRADQQQGADPSSTLRYLTAVSDKVERVGTEKVRGVESTHYRATVELRKYPNVVPRADREQARKSIDRLIDLSGDDQMQMEVWVGTDKLISRS
jgi:hypothetical protein